MAHERHRGEVGNRDLYPSARAQAERGSRLDDDRGTVGDGTLRPGRADVSEARPDTNNGCYRRLVKPAPRTTVSTPLAGFLWDKNTRTRPP